MHRAGPRLPQRSPIGYGQQILPNDLTWKLRWPSIVSIIIGGILIILAVVIIALEIASLAKGTGSDYKIAETGAGIWCGVFILVAGVFILMIKFMSRARQWAAFAFIADIVATGFSVILIGLDAKAVKYGNDISSHYELFTGLSYFPPKYRILVAQLALACIVFLFCILFIILFIFVLITAPDGRRQRKYSVGPPPRN